MPKITTKGQITIPLDIRKSFSMLPGTYVDIIDEDNRVVIVKSRSENKFMRWLGRGKYKDKKNIDLMLDQLRGRVDE
jgi:AbrB family looped-hinge helix DNA binding protein